MYEEGLLAIPFPKDNKACARGAPKREQRRFKRVYRQTRRHREYFSIWHTRDCWIARNGLKFYFEHEAPSVTELCGGPFNRDR